MCRSEAGPGPAREEAGGGSAGPRPCGPGGAGPGTESRRGEREREKGRPGPACPPAFLLPGAYLAVERGRRRELLSASLADPAPGAAGRLGAGRPLTAHSKCIALVGAGARPAGCPGPARSARRSACPLLPRTGPALPSASLPSPVTAAPAWPGPPRWLPLPFPPAPRVLRPRARPPATPRPRSASPALGLPTPAIPGAARPRPLLSCPHELLSTTSLGTAFGSSPAFCPPCPRCLLLSPSCILAIPRDPVACGSCLVVPREIPPCPQYRRGCWGIFLTAPPCHLLQVSLTVKDCTPGFPLLPPTVVALPEKVPPVTFYLFVCLCIYCLHPDD